ncbi:MAG: DUF2726 domain-containing protein [Alphaproteobacteria bacterium]|nr:DUF2726 domain-containing protein [Alphaproteobacteria bacterium]
MTTALFWIVGFFVAIFIATFIISMVFGRKWSGSRPLDPRRDQLAIVKQSKYFKRRIMNGEEYRLFQHLEQWMNARQCAHRLFAQVSLGEIIGSDDRSSYACINSKRCDFVIVDATGYPVLAIEYQGTGHFTPGAFERDNVKQQALESAGVRLVEVFDDFRWEDVQTQLDSALGIPERMSA